MKSAVVLIVIAGSCFLAGAQTITSVTTADAGPVIAQNTFIVIKGINLVPANTPATGAIWSSAPSFASGLMPTQLGGVSVTVNHNPAFVYFYCSAATDPQCAQDQLNILTPLDNTIGAVPIVVTNGAVPSPPFIANMQAAAPSFLLFNAAGAVAATHANNFLVGSHSLYPGSSAPATPGEAVVLYAVGFGLPATPLVNGSAKQSGSLPTLPVCQVGGGPADLVFAGLIAPGLYQMNLTIPDTTLDGDNAVTCSYNGFTTPVGAVITVRSSVPSPTLAITTLGTGGGTVNSSPPGTACGIGCLSFPAGTAVTLTAAPSTGSTFGGWSGVCSGTGSCLVTLSTNQAVTATFNLASAAQQTVLTGTYSSSGTCGSALPNWIETGTLLLVLQPSLSSLLTAGGSFSGVRNAAQTGGKDCPNFTPLPPNSNSNTGTVSGTVQPGGLTAITLDATGIRNGCVIAGSGTITSISGTISPACNTGAQGQGTTGSGTFQLSAAAGGTGTVLNIATVGSGSGRVVASPPGTSCGSNCLSFAAGTVVTLTAIANGGSGFFGWSGACSGRGACAVTMNSIQVVTATFNSVAATPVVSIHPTDLLILLPSNNLAQFSIDNTGPPGGSMDYLALDTNGLLTLNNDKGSLPGGKSTQVNVVVKPEFAEPDPVTGYGPGVIGSTQVVNIFTPQASNYVKLNVSVEILQGFPINVIVNGLSNTGDHASAVAVNVDTVWHTTKGSDSGNSTRTLQAAGASGDSYDVYVPFGDPGEFYCSVVSGASGVLGSSMPTAVVKCD